MKLEGNPVTYGADHPTDDDAGLARAVIDAGRSLVLASAGPGP